MSDQQSPRDAWKAEADFASVTTKVLTLLFAGLLLSFMGLWKDLHKYYPAALATSIGAENSRVKADRDRTLTMGSVGAITTTRLETRKNLSPACVTVRETVLAELQKPSIPPDNAPPAGSALGHELVRVSPTILPDTLANYEEMLAQCSWTPFTPPAIQDPTSPTQAELTKLNQERGAWLVRENQLEKERLSALSELAGDKDLKADPFGFLRGAGAQRYADRPWVAQLLQTEITHAYGPLADRERSAERRYRTNRVRPEDTPFDLLGLRLSVGGYWAWTVWLGFLAIGMYYLGFARQRLLRQAQTVWQAMFPAPFVVAGLPMWAYPLPHDAPWSRSLPKAQRPLTTDPLSTICTLSMLVCFLLGILIVLPMAMLSNWLLSAGAYTLERSLHLALLTLVAGVLVSLASAWASSPHNQGSKHEAASGRSMLGRREWLIGSVAAGCLATMTSLSMPRDMLRGWLLRPRTRSLRDAVRTQTPRIRRARRTIPELASGFYADHKGTIYFVPIGGKSRSLAGRSKEGLTRWHGPFNESELAKAHSSARIPFVYEGVTRLLRGLTHRPTGGNEEQQLQRIREKVALNRLEATKPRFRRAFNLVLAAIVHTPPRRKTNPQLFRLLAAIAANAQDPTLIHEANLAIENQLHAVRSRQEEEARLRQLQTVASSMRTTLQAGESTSPSRSTTKVRHSKRKLKLLREKLRDIALHAQRLSLDLTPKSLATVWSMLGSSSTFHGDVAGTVQETLRADDDDLRALLRQIFQKASRGEDFTAELYLIPATSTEEDRLERLTRLEVPGDRDANELRVLRFSQRKKPRTRSKIPPRAGWDLLG